MYENDVMSGSTAADSATTTELATKSAQLHGQGKGGRNSFQLERTPFEQSHSKESYLFAELRACANDRSVQAG
jgi:hypothetical protein